MINTSSNIGQHRKNSNNLETLISTANTNLTNLNTTLTNRISTVEKETQPIARGGTGATNRYDAIANLKSVGLYSRSDIGNTLNIDNPHVNGLFEIRTSELMPSGTIPCNGYYPLLNLKSHDNIVILQIAGTTSTGFYIRGKQAAGVTLANTAWQRLVTLKETYKSGDSWYRVYSDGWIEQGGSFSCSTNITATTTQVTFIKAFTSSVNIIGGFVKSKNSAAYGQLYFQNGNTTLTGMVCSVICYNSGGNVQHSISGGTGYWYACGY